MPVGNIFHDEKFAELKNGNCEKLQISRTELEKRILRRTTNRGTDVGFSLEPGVKLQHGDIIKNGDITIIIEQIPEKVITVKIKPETNLKVLVLLGHIIGNRHRPISFQKKKIIFPIQADIEKEVFEKLFHSIITHIEITVLNQIFFPHSGADVHEH